MKEREIERVIQRTFDGTATGDELLALRAALKSDPDVRTVYYEHAALHQSLEYRFSRSRGNEAVSLLAKARLRSQARRSARIAVFSAAAAVVLAGLLLRMILAPTVKPLATFESASGSIVSVSGRDDPQASSEIGKNATVQLSQGSLELTFFHGSRALILAPARFTLHGEKLLHLHQGTAWFRVEEAGHGFQVITPELRITDLGTEFGVRSDPAIGDEVHVFKGRVIARAVSGRAEEHALATGESRRADPIGRLEPVTSQPEAFLTRLPENTADGLIVNGGFESGNPPPNATFGTPASSALLPGWRFGDNIMVAGATLSGHPGYGDRSITTLSSTADLQIAFSVDVPHPPDRADTTLQQTFATEPGAKYEVQFEMGGIFFSNALLEVAVSVHRGTEIAGSPLATLTTVRDASSGNGYNPPARFTFKAASTLTTLSFVETSKNTTSSDPVLDNVSVRRLP
jgi:ferric-dicitrate binding protein FerR (iron transport regulator)